MGQQLLQKHQVARLTTGPSLVLAVFIAACASARYAGQSQAQLDADLRKRAACDLSCAESEVTVIPLAPPNQVDIVTSQGASGCGKQARASTALRATFQWPVQEPDQARRLAHWS